MSTIEQIEAAIEQLPREEIARLQDWMRERFDDAWDHEMENDAQSGRLDALAQTALAEHRAGRSVPFPSHAK